MSFEPKQKVELDPPKEDTISIDYLSKCDGECVAELKRQPQTDKVKVPTPIIPHMLQ